MGEHTRSGMSGKQTAAQRRYREFIRAAEASLGPNEYWAIGHPDGILEDTASKDIGWPVRVICEALQMDWDDLGEQGYHLVKYIPAGRHVMGDGNG